MSAKNSTDSIGPDQRSIGICPVFHAQLREAARPRLSLTPAATARGLYKPRMEPANTLKILKGMTRNAGTGFSENHARTKRAGRS
jgi:hypothetical protein